MPSRVKLRKSTTAKRHESRGKVTKRSAATGRFVSPAPQHSYTPRVQSQRSGSSLTVPSKTRAATSTRDFLNAVDALTARISAAWKDDMSAVDAVSEQRD